MSSERQISLEFESDDSLAGFRLARAEVLNWGTFNGKVWSVVPGGRNSLLTGDIGTGKSTFVDAITTLLVPAHRIPYNKAAGAEGKERSLKSYVLGYYKSERTEAGYGAKSVALRDHNSFSVILGVFTNKGYEQSVTLAQVFWQKEVSGQPERFYVVADRALSISADFSGFGSDVRALKKRLKDSAASVECFDSFPDYFSAFRRRFGIADEQALELFLQTVSMKSVGNLTDFVRTHMLEASEIKPLIERLIEHFDNLTRAHDLVLKAKAQIGKLGPMVADLDRHAELSALNTTLLGYREGLRFYFARLKKTLLEKRLENLDGEQRRIDGKIRQMEETREHQYARRDDLRSAIRDSGGDRLERLRSDIMSASAQRDGRLKKANDYDALADGLSLPRYGTAEDFERNLADVAGLLARIESEEHECIDACTDTEIRFRKEREAHDTLAAEIESLRRRRSNIDSRQIAIRERICHSLGMDEKDIPFAGELLQIRPGETRWEGVAERLLRGFALSMLVPEKRYREISEWVDANDLRGKLVYFKAGGSVKGEPRDIRPNSLVKKVMVREDTPFSEWIDQELVRRFNYTCCDDLDAFRREPQAVTEAGQIKGSNGRHEKDDRSDIRDRSRYVLGWSNEAKIEVLEQRRANLEGVIRLIADDIRKNDNVRKTIKERRTFLDKMAMFASFVELDWQSAALHLDDLKKEKIKIESGSDTLRSLNAELSSTEETISNLDAEIDKKKEDRAQVKLKREQAETSLSDCVREIEGRGKGEPEEWFAAMDTMRKESLGERTVTVESAENCQQEMREWLQRKIDNESKRMKDAEGKIIVEMNNYRRDYPAECTDVDATLAAAGEYRTMLLKLETDALPQFEMKFKQLLNEETIHEIAYFHSQLNNERQTIKEKIGKINGSLREIEYNKGRFIILDAQESPDHEIREFRNLLRECTEGSLTGSLDDQYAERKFLLVKGVIERFKGRDGSSESDRRWTEKTTDVRNWFEFAASERWREDDTEHEHYTDSGGKSGGQKEKLAYTILAASLAYQFGLEWGEVRSRSFRFVVIDEAFGRGSDESTRFGLELFRKLNLQILVVTPLQKIHIIEPYVSSVGFVHANDRYESQIRNLSITEYLEQKEGMMRDPV